MPATTAHIQVAPRQYEPMYPSIPSFAPPGEPCPLSSQGETAYYLWRCNSSPLGSIMCVLDQNIANVLIAHWLPCVFLYGTDIVEFTKHAVLGLIARNLSRS